MKLKRIKITELFGLEDNNFDIECYPNENVTILYAFNGVGKTTILRLIDAVINVKLQIIDSIAFKNIQLVFDNDDFVMVEKLGDYKNTFIKTKCKDLFSLPSNIPVYPIKYVLKMDNATKEYYLKLSKGLTAEVRKNADNELGSIEEVKELKFEKRADAIKKQKNIDLSNVSKNDIEIRPVNPLLFEYDAYIFFDWNDLCILEFELFDKIKQIFLSNLILANKQFEALPRAGDSPRYEIFMNYPPTIDDLYLSDEQFKDICAYNEFLKNEKKDSSSAIQFPVGIDKTRDISSTLGCWSKTGIHTKELELFHKLLNEDFGFMYKTIEYDDEKGLKVVPIFKGDPELGITQLSSGEKKLIILFYELLFAPSTPINKNIKPIFLIDEPETSFHVEWQKVLVKCILKICEYRNIQVIIATHSPSIVGEYWGLMSEVRSERFKYDKYF